MDQPHHNTCALVTGAAQGLGLAVARQLVSEGCARLAIADRNAEGLRAAAVELRGLGAEVSEIRVDMGDTAAVLDMIDRAVGDLGRVTALANCAGNTDRGTILDTPPELWDAIMNVNAKGPFFAIQRLAQHAIRNRHDASIVNIISIVVHGGLPFLAPYVASKAALLGITKNTANALARHRIRVNGINVGWMDTPGEDETQRKWHGRDAGWLADAEASTSFGRLVKPEEIARQTSFFLGPQSGVVTGSVMDFDQQVVGAYPDTNEK